jgi:hypothetical protein
LTKGTVKQRGMKNLSTTNTTLFISMQQKVLCLRLNGVSATKQSDEHTEWDVSLKEKLCKA